MALPKRRHSRSRTRKRRAHDALKSPNAMKCGHCDEPKLPHQLCSNCGTYNNRTVFLVEEELG